MESQLEGFEFARQREPVTDGIDVWGTVFELEHAHHGNIAVVILGTREIYFMASTGSLPGMNTYRANTDFSKILNTNEHPDSGFLSPIQLIILVQNFLIFVNRFRVEKLRS